MLLAKEPETPQNLPEPQTPGWSWNQGLLNFPRTAGHLLCPPRHGIGTLFCSQQNQVPQPIPRLILPAEVETGMHILEGESQLSGLQTDVEQERNQRPTKAHHIYPQKWDGPTPPSPPRGPEFRAEEEEGWRALCTLSMA